VSPNLYEGGVGPDFTIFDLRLDSQQHESIFRLFYAMSFSGKPRDYFETFLRVKKCSNKYISIFFLEKRVRRPQIKFPFIPQTLQRIPTRIHCKKNQKHPQKNFSSSSHVAMKRTEEEEQKKIRKIKMFWCQMP